VLSAAAGAADVRHCVSTATEFASEPGWQPSGVKSAYTGSPLHDEPAHTYDALCVALHRVLHCAVGERGVGCAVLTLRRQTEEWLE
jgi:hypothetical protein